MEETISRMAGSEHGSARTVADLQALAAAAGRPARERDHDVRLAVADRRPPYRERSWPINPPRTAFVLGGGGLLGGYEVGMLAALPDAGIRPDLVLGTSIGAINGVFVAADPDGAAKRLEAVWRSDVVRTAFRSSVFGRLGTLARSGTHLHSNLPLRRLLEEHLPERRFDALTVPFQCVAASVERAAARWFDRGDVIPAVLASAAVPGLLPPVRIGGEHFLDGGLVHSIPVGRAVQLGARAHLRAARRADRAPAGRRPAGRGRWGWSPSRSPGGTGSSRRWRPCPTASRCTCCRPGPTGGPT